MKTIIPTILNKMLDNLNAPLAYEEAMSTLFLPESGNILAKTIQVVNGHRWFNNNNNHHHKLFTKIPATSLRKLSRISKKGTHKKFICTVHRISNHSKSVLPDITKRTFVCALV